MNKLLAPVSCYYTKKIKEFGPVPGGADWNDKVSQELRFSKLVSIIDTDKAVTINDLGCGYAALYWYLKENKFRIKNYFGYDISPEMLKQARRLIKSNKAQFVNSHRIIFKADYSIASGIFNVNGGINNKEWEGHIKRTLFNMNEKSIIGFSFNCLTTYVDYKKRHLYYASPEVFFKFCKDNFSPYVCLIHDYKLFEWTILVKNI